MPRIFVWIGRDRREYTLPPPLFPLAPDHVGVIKKIKKTIEKPKKTLTINGPRLIDLT